MDVVYHFTFTGSEQRQATIVIQNKTLQVQDGHIGTANLVVVADSKTWLDFLNKEHSIFWGLMRRKIRVNGALKLLQLFGNCFPA